MTARTAAARHNRLGHDPIAYDPPVCLRAKLGDSTYKFVPEDPRRLEHRVEGRRPVPDVEVTAADRRRANLEHNPPAMRAGPLYLTHADGALTRCLFDDSEHVQWV
jgi:hypothetical protein